MELFQSIQSHMPPALLVIFRIGGLTIYGPVFGSPVIPARIKILLVFSLGLVVYPVLAASGHTSMSMPFHVLTLAPMIALELLVGLVIGFVASIPLAAVQTGGLVAGQQMGLGFARIFNPAMQDNADVVGQLLFFMTLSGFLLIDGHDAMLLSVLQSFERVPLGAGVVNLTMIEFISGILLAAFDLALRVAAPLLALIFVESVAMGFISKTVPQLNILSLGFPIRLIFGLGAIAISLIAIDQVIMEGTDTMLSMLYHWIDSQ